MSEYVRIFLVGPDLFSDMQICKQNNQQTEPKT